jgi:uncharacterized protein (DUF2252 family)
MTFLCAVAMSIHSATQSFETWIASQVGLDRGDLRHKHTAMGAGPFPFLRATYYYWAQRFPKVCPELAKAPTVVAVGDLHIENYGTWRDNWGRMVWGINDFDEAYPRPYTHDLVRLATSALLAARHTGLAAKSRGICECLLGDYRSGLKAGGRPFVAGAEHSWVLQIQRAKSRDPIEFWKRYRKMPRVRTVPAEATRLLEATAPAPHLRPTIVHRIAGMGNLGKPRYTAISEWHGAPAAWEVKALTLSAAAWASNQKRGPFYRQIISRAVRTPDPSVHVADAWISRRLAPDCQRIELAAITDLLQEKILLTAMGFELANVHLGSTKSIAAVQKDLRHRPANWLRNAAKLMRDDTITAWEAWQKRKPAGR